MSEIVSEDEIACKGVCEGLIKVENFEETISFDGVQIAVGEGSDVGCALTDCRIFPEAVSEDVAFSQDGHYFVILYHLQATSYNKTERVDRFPGVIQQIPWSAVRHGKMHRQSSQTSIGRQPKPENRQSEQSKDNCYLYEEIWENKAFILVESLCFFPQLDFY